MLLFLFIFFLNSLLFLYCYAYMIDIKIKNSELELTDFIGFNESKMFYISIICYKIPHNYSVSFTMR